MTRRRFYAPPEALSLGKKSVTLSAEETRHARDVLRLQRGEEVYVFDGEGIEYRSPQRLGDGIERVGGGCCACHGPDHIPI